MKSALPRLIMVRVAQVNLQRKRTTTLNLSRLLQEGKASIALVQEPYFHKGDFYSGNLLNPTFVAFNKSGMRNPRIMPRACILANSAIDASLLSELTTRDICAIVVNLTNENSVGKYVYCSAYLPHDESAPTDDFKKVVSYCENKAIPLIVGSDANAHHIIWGSSDINIRGSELMEYLSSTNLHLINVGNRPTFARFGREEVLDITLCSSRISQEVVDWQVLDEVEPSLSDHKYIFFDHSNVSFNVITYRNPKSTNWDLFMESLATKFYRYHPEIQSPNDLEQVVETFCSLTVAAYEEACPLRNVRAARGTPWWNAELARLKKRCRTAWNRRRRDGSEAFRLARKAYKNALRSSERAGWKSLCTNISCLNEACRLNKILSKSKDFQISSLKTANGEHFSDENDLLTCLFDTHFPGSAEPQLTAVPEFFSGGCDSWVIARRLVTTESIKWAIDSFSPYKSPGNDGIFPALLQKGFVILEHVLKKIIVSSLATGYIPSAWREIRIKFIPKSGRASYEEAKSFRPISLSSFLLKTVERIIDHYIRDVCLVEHPLHNMQHAYQRGKSTITLLHNVVSNIEKAFSQKQSGLGVFLDIEGAFDNVSFQSMIEAARAHGVPSFISNWMNEMLSNRILCSSLRYAEVRKLSICGCPQGGVLSPLLWNLVADGLLRKLNGLGLPTYGFADDYLVLIIGLSIPTIFDLMQQALRTVEQWCRLVGLSVNPDKTNMVLFTKKRNSNGVRPLQFFGSELVCVDQVKYVGVIMDSRKTWSAHIDSRIKKACMAFGQCRRSFGKSWGLKPKYIHWMYTTIVRPILAYGCLVWWQRGEVRTVQSKLSHLQRMALMAMTGAFTTTPTAALEALLDIKPLHVHLKQEALACAYRLQVTGHWTRDLGNNAASHIRLWPEMVAWDKDILAPSDMTIACSFPYRSSLVNIPPRQEWLSGFVERRLAEHVVCYTDGSLMDGRAGAGVYCRELRLEQSHSLGRYCTVFQAEIFAIMCGTQAALQQRVCGRIIDFCSDSQSAIKALTSADSRSKLVIACRNQIEELSILNAVHLVWVPGHSGITGNEWADELARKGAEIDFVGPEPVLPISSCWIKRKIRSWAPSEHAIHWRNIQTCRQTKTFLVEPSRVFSENLLHFSKHNCSTLVRALTGHCKLNYHMATIQRSESYSCDLCESNYGTSYHLICDCPAVSQLRIRIFGCPNMDESAFKQLKLKDFLLFLTRCGKEL